MRKSNDKPEATGHQAPVNPGFASVQLAKALLASEQHTDAALAERATRRVADWQAILSNVLSGAAQYGSRTPIPDVPAWATLDVATGGFATGRLLAGGPLEVYERELLDRLGIPEDDVSRLRLNAYFLTEAGIGELQSWLDSGYYSVRFPEEGALLTVAGLTRQGKGEAAREIINAISPFFPTLRFYPVPDYRAHCFDVGVHVQDVATTRAQLRRLSPHAGILAQRAAVQSWAPLYDRLLALFAETMAGDDWPCQVRPPDWSERADALLNEFEELERRNTLPSKYRKSGSHYVQLRGYLRLCSASFGTVARKDVARIRHILNCSIAKRGHPLSAQNAAFRGRQQADVAAPLYTEIAEIVEQRLGAVDQAGGLDNTEPFKGAVTADEATATVSAGTAIPRPVKRRLERCLIDSIEALTRRGLISSGEAMAKVLPQLTAGLHGSGIEEPGLRQLYAAIYRAFRRRRSLLLLNLASQVRVEELPWVSAIDLLRRKDLSEAEASRQAMEQIVGLALEFFPHAILPNKLIRELGALASRATLRIPLVDELAADIFMGQFTPKFTEAAKLACKLLGDSLYVAYYQIDVDQIDRLPDDEVGQKHVWPWQRSQPRDEFARLCAARAGVELGGWRPATNGMIIEQQQILTTQNMAALVAGLDLRSALQGRFAGMAQSCFRWICARNQMRVDGWHARLILVKKSAYAWRQMIFFMSLLPHEDLLGFLDWADGFYAKQSPAFQSRFLPAFDGLKRVANGLTPHPTAAPDVPIQPFLGWSDSQHWLMR